MTPEGRAGNIVDSFFIGGEGDDLCQPNLTKADLRRVVLHGIRAAEIEALEYAKSLYEAQADHPEKQRGPYFLSLLRAEIERRKTV